MKRKATSVIILILGVLLTSCNVGKGKAKDAQDVRTTEINNEVNNSLVFQAALEGGTQVVQNALEKGFDPNTTDEYERTALMLAGYNGHTEIVKLLIENGANVNAIDNVNRTALMYASSGPFENTVSELLRAGANPNLTEKEENWTAVMMAASEGQLEVLKILVANGGDLNMVDIDGESSLDFAKSKDFDEVVHYIISQTEK